MKNRHLSFAALSIDSLLSAIIAIAVGLATPALAQEWPAKPMRVVIPFAAGSVSEAIFRVMAPSVESRLGQRFVVESKPGADGHIGVGEVIRSAADGYTLLLAPTANFAVTPHMFKNLGFDPLTALDPISLLADAPLLAVTGANVPSRSLKEFVEYVRASPGKYNYGSPGSGSPAHLAGAAFSQMTGNAMVYIPYKGTVPMITAMLAGDVQAAFPTLTGIIGQLKAGKLRAIALLGAQRTALLPDVSTATEQGFPGIEADAWNALFAKSGTQPAIIDRMHRESVRILSSAEVRESLLKQGMEVEVSDPKVLGQRVRDDRAKWARAIKEFNVKAED